MVQQGGKLLWVGRSIGVVTEEHRFTFASQRRPDLISSIEPTRTTRRKAVNQNAAIDKSQDRRSFSNCQARLCEASAFLKSPNFS